MDAMFWAKAHGATTHFPLALACGAAAFDVAGLALASRPLGRDLQAAGYWCMLLAAHGSVGAVCSGLAMTNGTVAGHGELRLHHLFAWPAFGLLVGLATWRVKVGRQATRRMLIGYGLVACAAAGVVLTAGYWGGEMMVAAGP